MPVKFAPVMTATINAANIAHISPVQLVGYHGTDQGQYYAGDDTNNVAYGNGGDDVMFGNGGDDRMYGGTGNDVLMGGAGNDHLTGGAGKDILYGGDGADTFIFKIGDSGITTASADVIKDMSVWDRIDVSDTVANGHNNVVQNTSITSIDQAAAVCNMMSSLNGPSDTHAVLFANAANNTSYLVMDMDGNGTFETGVVIEGMGHPTDAALDWMLT